MIGQILQSVLLSVSVLPASIAGLEIGDPAPKLDVKAFIRGRPVTAFEKGTVYVVEFWATWCGPCRRSMPHLSRLQKKYRDVVFIGADVWEPDQAKVKPYVEKLSAKMDYRVAIDAVPEGAKFTSGAMAINWVQATEQAGIPIAYIVDRSTRIAWIGDPSSIEHPLAEVVAGTWTMEKGSAARRVLLNFRANMQKADKAGDPKQIIAAVDEAIAADPDLEMVLAPFKFEILLLQIKDEEKAIGYGRRLVDALLKDDADGLRELCTSIADPKAPKFGPMLARIAVTAALRADKLSGGKDATIAATLARAYFDSGDAVKAMAAQERAIKLAKGTDLEKEPELRERLEQYRKASTKH